MSSRASARVSGPLAVFDAGFRGWLERRGYRPGTVTGHLSLLADVSRWLERRGLGAGDLTETRVERFSAERRASGRSRLRSGRALEPLVEYLREVGAAPAPVAPTPSGPVERLVQRYAGYLGGCRGLPPGTVRNYVGVAHRFLLWRDARAGLLTLDRLDVATVIAFVLEESQRLSVGSAKCMVTRLRALLRFLFMEGEIGRDLSGAVPSVASWRLAGLVRALDSKSLTKLVGSCDRRRRVGRRDYAALVLLSRLGLRAGELAALRLTDIDWRCGELLVRGKGGRLDRLPLPVDVGEALAGWLSRGRPDCGCAFVFTTVRAPLKGLSPGGISAIVRGACRRAGLPVTGAHRLRHTAATEMLRSGSSLMEVGQVLRHQSLDVTSIYAKVDRLALEVVVQPWPGAAA